MSHGIMEIMPLDIPWHYGNNATGRPEMEIMPRDLKDLEKELKISFAASGARTRAPTVQRHQVLCYRGHRGGVRNVNKIWIYKQQNKLLFHF